MSRREWDNFRANVHPYVQGLGQLESARRGVQRQSSMMGAGPNGHSIFPRVLWHIVILASKPSSDRPPRLLSVSKLWRSCSWLFRGYKPMSGWRKKAKGLETQVKIPREPNQFYYNKQQFTLLRYVSFNVKWKCGSISVFQKVFRSEGFGIWANVVFLGLSQRQK